MRERVSQIKDRELLWAETDTLTGWKCGGCGWTRPVPKFSENNDPDMDTKLAFEGHYCTRYLLKRKTFREGAKPPIAEQIVREILEEREYRR